MKEKRHKDKHYKKHKQHKDDKAQKNRQSSISSTSSDSEEWIEKKSVNMQSQEREDWMSMTGMLKTYTNNDIKPKREEINKNSIDSYNPATNVRELNPYWKDGGTGLPQSSESFHRNRQFLRPADDNNYYVKKSRSDDSKTTSSRTTKINHTENNKNINDKAHDAQKIYNWKMNSVKTRLNSNSTVKEPTAVPSTSENNINKLERDNDLYMSDEKLNKLAAKVVKAEIMGDTMLVAKLKAKLEAAREYRKQNPNAGAQVDDDRVMLMAISSSGSSRPLNDSLKGDPKSRGNKRKAETHVSGERTKYFSNDDKFNLSQMFEQEKYGSNYDDEAQIAKIVAKNKNPNDDLEDIFVDDISKSRNRAKDKETEKQRAINQHMKLERSLEGCEYCVDSKNMVKHLMVSCGNKVYIALPGKQSLVTGQCVITTIQHHSCVTSLDEDIWEEILIFRKALTQFFNSKNMDAVFYETAVRLHRFPHVVINCVPLPRDVGDMAAIYFKKALLECETEWSMNKKVVDLKGKNIRKGVPKGLPYFWVDFGMEPGFAHVIEDQQLFPRTFAEEIIAGMLDLEHHLWKYPKREYGDLQRKKVLEFIKEWKPYDPNKV